MAGRGKEPTDPRTLTGEDAALISRDCMRATLMLMGIAKPTWETPKLRDWFQHIVAVYASKDEARLAELEGRLGIRLPKVGEVFPPPREPPVKRKYKKREPKVRPPPPPEQPLPAKRNRTLSSAAVSAMQNPTNTWGTALRPREAPGGGGAGGSTIGQRGPGGWGGYRPPPLPKLPAIMSMPHNFQPSEAVRLRNLREALDVFREEATDTHQERLTTMNEAEAALVDARGEALQRYLRNVRMLEGLFDGKDLASCALDDVGDAGETGGDSISRMGATAAGGGGSKGGGAEKGGSLPLSGNRRNEEIRERLLALQVELGAAVKPDEDPASQEVQKRMYSTSLFETLLLRLAGSQSLDDPNHGLLGIVNEYCAGFKIDKESHFAAGLRESTKTMYAAMNNLEFVPEAEAARALPMQVAGAPEEIFGGDRAEPESESESEEEEEEEDVKEEDDVQRRMTDAERDRIRAEAAAEREALLRSCFEIGTGEKEEEPDPAEVRGESGLLLTEEAEVTEVVDAVVDDVEEVDWAVDELVEAVESQLKNEAEEAARAQAAAAAAAEAAARPPKIRLVAMRKLPKYLFSDPPPRRLPGAPLPAEALKAPAITLVAAAVGQRA